MTNEEQLSGLKQRLEQIRSFKARCDERINVGLEQLAKYGCQTIEDAETLHDTIDTELPKLQTKYDGLIRKAEEVIHGVEIATGQGQNQQNGITRRSIQTERNIIPNGTIRANRPLQNRPIRSR